jgi:hypothetical protein
MSDPAQSDGPASDRVRALTERFYDWELRGRGWQVWNYAVDLEPAFRPAAFDFGGEPGRRKLWDEEGVRFEGWDEPFPDPAAQSGFWRHIPLDPYTDKRAFPALPEKALAAYEIIARGRQVRAQLSLQAGGPSAGPDALSLLRKDLPEARAGVEFGLAEEFLLPLPETPDGAHRSPLSLELTPDETVVAQILFKPVANHWAEAMLRAALGPVGNGLFAREDDLVSPCQRKIAEPLYAAAIRLLAAAPSPQRARELAALASGALCPRAVAGANRLIALPEADDAFGVPDLFSRQTRRSGMLLNRRELAGFVPALRSGQTPALATDYPPIRRVPITPEEGLLRPAMLARFAQPLKT